MTNSSLPEELDPRTKRTRAALRAALETVLARKCFDKISVADIAEAGGLNRATFYDHYADKFALLESLVEVRFNGLLAERAIVFDGCSGALRAMIAGVCDFVATAPRLDGDGQSRLVPHWESAVIAVVRRMIYGGLEREGRPNASMIASTVSWAMYGAAKEWLSTPNRRPCEEIVDVITAMMIPLLKAN